MLLYVGQLLGGGVLLYFGAEWLVKGAASLARAFGVAPLVVGLTVVAYGTSAPELVVSMLAAIDGKPAIALGNVVGSNIANLGLILGITALISPPSVEGGLIRREIPILLGSAMLVPILLVDDQIGRVDGTLLVVGALAFTASTVRAAKALPAGSPFPEEMTAEVRAETEGTESASKAYLIGLSVAGLALLVGGGKLLVDGASGLALALGMSERLVGLTIVAIGTSLPELAASVIAALRGHSSIAIGNVVGSNIFNILLILGGASLAAPIPGDVRVLAVDIVVLLSFSIMAIVLMRTARTISRVEGGVLVAAYLCFLAVIAAGSGGS